MEQVGVKLIKEPRNHISLLKGVLPGKTGSADRLVALTSGGIDSTVMTYVLTSRGYDVLPLFVDYGQKAAARELSALKQVLPSSLRSQLAIVKIPGMKHASGSRLVGGPVKDFWMPHRNLLLLTIAAVHARNVDSAIVAIGIIGEASVAVPDADLAFMRLAAKVLAVSAGTVFEIITPLRELSKSDVLRIGADHGVPTEKTWSCFFGRGSPCGLCPACEQRKSAQRKSTS